MEHREGRQSRSGGRGGGGQHTSFDNGWHADPMQRRKMIQQPPMRGAGKAAEESARRRVERAMRSQQEQRRPEGKARKGSSAPFGLMKGDEAATGVARHIGRREGGAPRGARLGQNVTYGRCGMSNGAGGAGRTDCLRDGAHLPHLHHSEAI